jgi:spore coat polysaccharide biosynthesis predicted glycosyltransferase SpsG
VGEDAAETVAYCAERGLRVGVLDHFRIDEEYQQVLARGGLEWMQFGNARHMHPLLGAWVHDANPAARHELFKERQRWAETAFLLGPRFALVNEMFAEERARLGGLRRGGVEAVLLMFGGGNDGGATERALDWLDAVGFAGKRVILTSGMNRNVAALRARAVCDERIVLQVDNWQPAEWMGRCQLAITAGGTSVYELACLGVPMVIVCTAENQWVTAQALAAMGLAVNLEALEAVVDEVAEGEIGSLLADGERRWEMARRGWVAVDGEGAERVAQVLLSAGGQVDRGFNL